MLHGKWSKSNLGELRPNLISTITIYIIVFLHITENMLV